jgi:phosphatidylserine decarboxylase
MSVATFAAAQVLRALPRTRVSRAVGRLCDLKLPPAVSRAVVNMYVRAYGVDLEECVPCQGAYPSFDQFFTRELRSGQRAIAEHDIVSPADGKVESLGPIAGDGSLEVKHRPYRVAELVGDAEDAKRYQGGQFAVVYLSPRDYHRVHAPVSGEIPLVRSLPGDLFPVNSIGERHVPTLFSRNRRVAIVIDTPALGRVTVVMVGAIIVGRITVSVVDGPDVPLGNHVIHPSRSVNKGDEIGIFHLGSTAIVFVEPGVVPPLLPAPRRVRMGESLLGVL